MRETIGGLLLLATVAFFAPAPAVAGDGDDDGKLDINAGLRTRFEYLDNFDDFDDDAGASFDFTTYLLRLGLDYEIAKNLSASFQVQHNGAWGDTFVRGTGDPTTDGSSSAAGKDATLLYQAFVDWKNVAGTPIALRIGRQEHTLGNELQLGDNDFYNGLSFDGIRAMVDFAMTDLDVFFYKIVERDLVGPGGDTSGAGSNDTRLWGAHANFDIAEGQTIEPYLFSFRNGAQAGASTFTDDIYTVGALYEKPRGNSRGMDWSAELALQNGETASCPPTVTSANCDLSSYAVEGWFGYAFGGDGQHRVHIGGLILGDGDDANESEAYTSLFTDTHGRAGALDLFSATSTSAITGLTGSSNTFQNLTVLDLGYGWSSGPHSVYAAYLDFTATEDFGGEDDIGSEIDAIYDFTMGDHLALQLGVAMFMPGNAFVAPGDDDAQRFWAMLSVFK
jgi:hypothetical protein